MKHAETTRIVAVDARSSRLGYAVFEAPMRLIDWGVKGTKGRMGNARIADLLALFQPSVVVLPRIVTNSKRNSVGVRSTVQAVRCEACRASLPIAIASERAVKTFFERHGFRTRHEIASVLARSFPELAWKLPPRRKAWESEPARMSIFDAVRLGIAFLASQSNSEDSGEIDSLLQKQESFRRPLGDVAK